MKKIVISGGPCSGKTEVISELRRRGYYVIQEAALYLIQQEEVRGGNIFPWTSPEEFQKKVYTLQKEWEDNIPLFLETVYLDRGLVDCIAYYQIYNLPVPPESEYLIKKADYNQVYYLELLPEGYWGKTSSGKPRQMRYERGVEIHKTIRDFYLRYCIDLIDIPFIPTNQRVDWIESSSNKNR